MKIFALSCFVISIALIWFIKIPGVTILEYDDTEKAIRPEPLKQKEHSIIETKNEFSTSPKRGKFENTDPKTLTTEQITSEIDFLEREIESSEIQNILNNSKGSNHAKLKQKWQAIFDFLTQLRSEKIKRELQLIKIELSKIEQDNRSKLN